jgi:hypothetical protein
VIVGVAARGAIVPIVNASASRQALFISVSVSDILRTVSIRSASMARCFIVSLGRQRFYSRQLSRLSIGGADSVAVGYRAPLSKRILARWTGTAAPGHLREFIATTKRPALPEASFDGR